MSPITRSSASSVCKRSVQLISLLLVVMIAVIVSYSPPIRPVTFRLVLDVLLIGNLHSNKLNHQISFVFLRHFKVFYLQLFIVCSPCSRRVSIPRMPPAPKLTGPLTENNRLRSTQQILKSRIVGPESIAIGSDGKSWPRILNSS